MRVDARRLLWVLSILAGLTVVAHGQVPEEAAANEAPMTAFVSEGDRALEIRLYKKDGEYFVTAATLELKGKLDFNQEGIVAGIENLRRLKFVETKNKWLSITQRELVAGRAKLTTEDGRNSHGI